MEIALIGESGRSNRPDGARGAAELHLRWLIERADRADAVLQDQIDCAELAVATGLRGAARMLGRLVTLHTGFAPASAAGDGGFSIDIAVAELRQLLSVPAAEVAADAAGATREPLYARMGRGPEGVKTAAAVDFGGIDELLGGLCAILGQPPCLARAAELERLLHVIAHGILSRPAIDLRPHLGDRLDDLVACFAVNRLRAFFLANWGICFGPSGSAALLHAASRLGQRGLGPYLGNVQQLVRKGRDIFGLIQIAAQHGGRDPIGREGVERWAALLSTHLDRPTHIDLVNEMGDMGLNQALADTLRIAERQAKTHHGRDLLWNIRDAALDNGDFGMAARAQAVIAARWPQERIEWRILGDIHATAGHRRPAVRAFANMLRIDRDDRSARERLAALRAGRFGPFAVTAGYGTPRHRQTVRLRRRPGQDKAAIPVR